MYFISLVWQLGRKKCWRTFKHLYAIVSVAIGEEICITGGSTGKIKVFNLETGNLIKVRKQTVKDLIVRLKLILNFFF
jgi:hypothetical protein